MRLEWLLNPMTVYGIAAAGLLLALVLFVSIKREMAKARVLSQTADKLRSSDESIVRGLGAEIESLRATLRNLEAAPPARPSAAGINLTKRAQALRMHRRGETVPSIAAALETPANEIALLLKVQALTGDAQRKAS